MNRCRKIYVFTVVSLAVLFFANVFNITLKAAEDEKKIVYHLTNKGNVNEVLFTGDELVWPGKTLKKEFYIANDNGFQCYIKNIIVDGELKNKEGKKLDKDTIEYKNFMKDAKIIFSYEGKEIFNGSGEEFLSANLLGDNSIAINSGEMKKFAIEFTFDKASSNSTMNLQYIFNIHANIAAAEGTGLVQTGYLIDDKVLIAAGIIFCLLGVTVILKKKYD